MTTIKLDLRTLHGFRLLSTGGDAPQSADVPASLSAMLGARLGSKIGDPKASSSKA